MVPPRDGDSADHDGSGVDARIRTGSAKEAATGAATSWYWNLIAELPRRWIHRQSLSRGIRTERCIDHLVNRQLIRAPTASPRCSSAPPRDGQVVRGLDHTE